MDFGPKLQSFFLSGNHPGHGRLQQKEKKRKFTPLGVVTGASRPRGSLRLCRLQHLTKGYRPKLMRLSVDVIQQHDNSLILGIDASEVQKLNASCCCVTSHRNVTQADMGL